MLKQKDKLPEFTKVIIHSLGPSYEGQEFYGTIRGIAIDDLVRIYIVELTLESKWRLNWEYSCISMTESCLKVYA